MSFPLSLPNLRHAVEQIMLAAIRALGTDGMRRGTPEPLLAMAQRRMQQLHSQIRQLILKGIAGALPKPRPKRPPPDRAEGWTPRPRAKSPWPRAFGWAVKLAGGGACMDATRVGWLIDNDEEMRRLFAAAPQIARPIRSLYWMMAQTLPPALRKPEVMVPVPPDYVDKTYKMKGGGITFTRHAMLVMQGWRPPTAPPKRKPRKPSAAKLAERAARQELKRIKAWVLADDEAKLKLGRGWLRRPRPKSRILGI